MKNITEGRKEGGKEGYHGRKGIKRKGGRKDIKEGTKDDGYQGRKTYTIKEENKEMKKDKKGRKELTPASSNSRSLPGRTRPRSGSRST
jgi:hypothetical protein